MLQQVKLGPKGARHEPHPASFSVLREKRETNLLASTCRSQRMALACRNLTSSTEILCVPNLLDKFSYLDLPVAILSSIEWLLCVNPDTTGSIGG
jgi:hypothetical protein